MEPQLPVFGFWQPATRRIWVRQRIFADHLTWEWRQES